MLSVSDRQDTDDSVDFDPQNAPAVVSAVQAMREIITAEVVHNSSERARALVAEYVQVHGRYLVFAGATFVDYHATDETTPDLAEDRFYYLLTRVGSLIQLLAERGNVDESVILLDVLDSLNQAGEGVAEPLANALRAAQTCLVAHNFVRRGRAPWGIQNSLDRTDMLVVNRALGLILVIIACTCAQDCWRDVVEVLLHEARHLLGRQARAAAITVEYLVEGYFVSLALRESSLT